MGDVGGKLPAHPLRLCLFCDVKGQQHSAEDLAAGVDSAQVDLVFPALPLLPELEQPERFYREAVYREYTALPADTAQAMQALAARAGIRTDGGTEETARQVAQYIGSAARYSLDTPVQPRDEDFVLHFLTQSRQGYCVHFASAAAVMLRALDIPAGVDHRAG